MELLGVLASLSNRLAPLMANRLAPLMGATKRFRIGNHPVRQQELEREFGAVLRVALFTSRSLAKELSAVLNAER